MNHPIQRIWTAQEIAEFARMFMIANQHSPLADKCQEVAEFFEQCTRLWVATKEQEERIARLEHATLMG